MNSFIFLNIFSWHYLNTKISSYSFPEWRKKIYFKKIIMLLYKRLKIENKKINEKWEKKLFIIIIILVNEKLQGKFI